ncbi:MAG: hypothetical protein DRO62_01850 [Candidatus Altiarchaeales archaeon]|nr:MAG: hypothetical protein DRO62_01850 [Candidatus Altiarchaeales archaeon]
MNDPIVSRLNEVKKLSWKIHAFCVILNTIIVFLAFAIILRFFGIPAIIAACPAIVYLMINVIYRIHRTNVIKSIVIRYPSLNERLQTAYDNRNARNIIVESLIKDVSRRMDKIWYSSFLDTKEVMSRTILTVILVFIFLSINFINIEDLGFNFQGLIGRDFLDQIENLTGFDIVHDNGFQWEKEEKFESKNRVDEDKLGGKSGGELPGINEGPIPGFGGGAGEKSNPDIYGKASSAKIAGRDIDMEVHPEYGGEIEIKDVEEEEIRGQFSRNLKGKSAEIPEQDPVWARELIREYFQSLQNILEEEE